MAHDLKLDKQLVYAFGVTVRCAKEIFVVATNLEWLNSHHIDFPLKSGKIKIFWLKKNYLSSKVNNCVVLHPI